MLPQGYPTNSANLKPEVFIRLNLSNAMIANAFRSFADPNWKLFDLRDGVYRYFVAGSLNRGSNERTTNHTTIDILLVSRDRLTGDKFGEKSDHFLTDFSPGGGTEDESTQAVGRFRAIWLIAGDSWLEIVEYGIIVET